MVKDTNKMVKDTFPIGQEPVRTLTNAVSEMLEAELREKRLELGKPLPSERELAGRFGVSTITIRQALAGLEKAGKIFRVPKVGTFAGPPPEREFDPPAGENLSGIDNSNAENRDRAVDTGGGGRILCATFDFCGGVPFVQ